MLMIAVIQGATVYYVAAASLDRSSILEHLLVVIIRCRDLVRCTGFQHVDRCFCIEWYQLVAELLRTKRRTSVSVVRWSRVGGGDGCLRNPPPKRTIGTEADRFVFLI